jgi:hypothetical protein
MEKGQENRRDSRGRSIEPVGRSSSPPFQLVNRAGDRDRREKRQILVDQDDFPGKFFRRGDLKVEYVEDGAEKCIFNATREVSWHPKKQMAVLHPAGSIYITSSITHPTDLPAPAPRMPLGLMSNYRIVFKPFAACFIHSFVDQCDCLQIGLREVHHRQSVIPMYCSRRSLLLHREMEVPMPDGVERYQENPCRIFVWSDEVRAHVLGVPSPYLISVRWNPKVYKPAFASCHSNKVAKLYLSLFNPAKYRAIAAIYMQSPETWTPETHPFFSEPLEGSELYHTTRDLYGLETLFRVGLVSHPCNDTRAIIYVATDQYLRTPVIDSTMKFAVDDFIARVLYPFYAAGAGMVLCAVCLYRSTPHREELLPAFFNRPDFITHYRRYHWDHSITSGLANATGLGARHYQLHLLYTLCLGHIVLECDLEASPFADMGEVGLSNMLRRVMVAPDLPEPIQPDFEVDE